MIKPFHFASLPVIYFKPGGIGDLPSIIKQYGGNIILVTGRHSFIDSEGAKLLLQKFSNEGYIHEHIIIPGEPSPDDIDQNVGRLSREKYDCVVGIGGGSVLDAGKAISAMIYKTGSVADYLEGVGTKDHPGTKLPFIAIPTTSGTGSEATKNAVISRIGKNGFKRSLRHESFVPNVAIVDPELTLNCPKHITAASGMDCLTQLMEAYMSSKSNPYTDALALEGMKAIKTSLVRSFNTGHDIEARSGMSFAALTSGICLANAGLGAVHGFASSIGARYNISHGVICGTLMAASNDITVRKLRKNTPDSPALKKYAALGEIFIKAENKGEDYLIDGFIEYLYKLSEELPLPGLKKAGVKEEDLEDIAGSTECKNNPVKLENEELLEILYKSMP
ncbi:MAG: iron-containing alcohol dehydrogenase [Bacteroidales bacterium]|nr:iron-containing alcohol dehydrogenase [Bacteroidales bacterium]